MGFKNIEGQLVRWIEELAVYNMEIVHRPGKDHVNADGLSRIPDPLVQCNYYSYICDVQDLPCGGCKYCVRANKQWDRFHDEVDDIVPHYEQSGPNNKQQSTTHGNAPKGSGSYLRPKTHIQHTHPQHLSTSTQTSTNHKSTHRNRMG